MRKFTWITYIMILTMLFIVGCSNAEEEAEVESDSESAGTEEKAQEAGEELNLLNHKSDAEALLDVEHEHYPFTEEGGFKYEYMTYIDEDVAISSVDPDTGLAAGLNWKTEELIWDEDVAVFADGYSENPIVDGWLYYKWNDDEYKKITIDPNEENNEEEIDEEEYEIFSNEFLYDDRSYVVEKDGDDYVVVSYDLDTLEKQWEYTPANYTSINGYVKEVGDYVLINSDAFDYFVLDKETGEVLFEDDIFYSDGILVDDKIYLVTGVGGGTVTYTFHVLDTNTWEIEEVVDPASNGYDYDIREYLDYNDGVLSFHLDKGVVGTDVESKNPFMNFNHFNEEESIDTLGYGYVDTIVHEDKFYILSYQDDSNPHGVLSIMDIKSGEVLDQYDINDFTVLHPEEHTKVFEKINEEQFIIVSEEDGMYEFDFASFE